MIKPLWAILLGQLLVQLVLKLSIVDYSIPS